jgi:PAS domain-containing protein
MNGAADWRVGRDMRSSVVQEVHFPKQPALQLIYDTAPIGLAYLSPDCRYLQINQRLTAVRGISVEGRLGRHVRECVPALADAVESCVRSWNRVKLSPASRFAVNRPVKMRTILDHSLASEAVGDCIDAEALPVCIYRRLHMARDRLPLDPRAQ